MSKTPPPSAEHVAEARSVLGPFFDATDEMFRQLCITLEKPDAYKTDLSSLVTRALAAAEARGALKGAAEEREVLSHALARRFLDSVWTDAYNMALAFQQEREAAKVQAVAVMAGNIEVVLEEARTPSAPESGGGGK